MSRILPRPSDGYVPGMRLTRRAVLGGAVAGLAACSSRGSSAPAPSPSASPTAVPSPHPSAVRTLEQRLTGRVLRPGSSGYRASARLYDPRYDGQAGPTLLAQVASTKDVAECVRWATETGTPLRVRAGGVLARVKRDGPADLRRQERNRAELGPVTGVRRGP